MTQPGYKKNQKEIYFIGLLHTTKKLYLGYQVFYDDDDDDHITVQCTKEFIEPKALAYITRNQQTKRYLMLNVRTLNVGITTTVFFGI